MLILCNTILFLNVLWDAISALAIWFTSCARDVLCLDSEEAEEPQGSNKEGLHALLAGMHTSMWSRRVDSKNHAACMLMAWWVLTLGVLRFLALYKQEFMLCAVLSYGIEACAFFVEGLKSTMIPNKACPTALFSLGCMLITLGCMPQA